MRKQAIAGGTSLMLKEYSREFLDIRHSIDQEISSDLQMQNVFERLEKADVSNVWLIIL